MRTLDQIRLKPNERAAIEAAAAILREKLPVAQIILFGSKARGDDDEDSDIDLLLLTEHRLSWDERGGVVELLSPLQLEYDVFFSPVDIAEDDWLHGIYQVMPLRDEVERDGAAAIAQPVPSHREKRAEVDRANKDGDPALPALERATQSQLDRRVGSEPERRVEAGGDRQGVLARGRGRCGQKQEQRQPPQLSRHGPPPLDPNL